MELYRFQEQAVTDVLNGFKAQKYQCLAWYTGAGKTNVFLECTKRLEEMDKIFPLKLRAGKWNEKTVIEAFKKCKTRSESRTKCSGALYWTVVNKRKDLRRHLPPALTSPRWNEESVTEKMRLWTNWNRLRAYPGIRGWMQKNGGETFWRKKFCEMKGIKYKVFARGKYESKQVRGKAG